MKKESKPSTILAGLLTFIFCYLSGLYLGALSVLKLQDFTGVVLTVVLISVYWLGYYVGKRNTKQE